MLTHVVVKECDYNYVTDGKFRTWPLQCKIPGFVPANHPINKCWLWSNISLPGSSPWKHHRQTLMTPFGQPKFTLVKTLLKNPWFLVHPSMSAGTFAAFSKFPLKTSNSPNTKVVYFVEGHNFRVEWHCWFVVQIDENCKSMSAFTVHQGRDFCQVSLQFMSNPLI
jgi:hypothetical protein